MFHWPTRWICLLPSTVDVGAVESSGIPVFKNQPLQDVEGLMRLLGGKGGTLRLA
ncbi:hypothetical protein ACQKL0_02580 [Peribacillus sp. NPDC097264]|uniref:hypothetical protein n=1 Tax=unclassified Peribacillus TaxID=2675266 RepID=UPI0038200CBE